MIIGSSGYMENKKRKEITEEQVEAYKECVRTDYKWKRKIMFVSLKVITITTLVVILIKVLFGSIELYNVVGYPKYKVRYYQVMVNGKDYDSEFVIKNKKSLIPSLIYFTSYYKGTNFVVGGKEKQPEADGSDEYRIGIKSYSCYKGKYQVKCENSSQYMRKNYDTKYVKMLITKIDDGVKEIYQGAFMKDIAQFVSEKGVYRVEILALFDSVETTISFKFHNE